MLGYFGKKKSSKKIKKKSSVKTSGKVTIVKNSVKNVYKTPEGKYYMKRKNSRGTMSKVGVPKDKVLTPTQAKQKLKNK